MNKFQLAIYELVMLALVALVAMTIFNLSSQSGPESASLSYEVTDVVVRITDPEKSIDRDDAQYIKEHSIVRQCAHALEYAVLAFLIMVALAPFRFGLWKKFLLTIALCALCSVVDEWNQSFVAGRGSELKDVLTDVGGSCVGVAVSLLLRKILILAANKGAFWRMREE